MSWAEAQKEAQRWLDRLQIAKDLKGQTVDLRDAAKELGFTDEFRRMVLQAARRKLAKKNAGKIILE